jgi:hypothetical protein
MSGVITAEQRAMGYRRVALFALPLAVSGFAMNGESPVVNAGVSRLALPERELAAFGVAMTIAWLIESPIVMLLDAVTARGVDQRSFALMRRYALCWCAALVAVAGGVAFTPLGQLLLRSVLGVEPDVARAAQRALAVLCIWPAAVAWRRIHQGILIRLGQTRVIGYAVALRLTTVVSVITLGVWRGGLAGATLGACALACGVTVESSCVWLVARSVLRGELPLDSDEVGAVRDLRAFHRYYLPLAGTMLCFMISSPLLTAGLAHGSEPALSLAVWPVAYTLVLLLTSPLNGMQQVAVRLGRDECSARVTRRLLLGSGVAVSALLVACNASGVTNWLLATAINSPANTRDPAVRVIWLLSGLPLLVAARALCRGLLVADGRTGVIQVAIIVNVLALAAMLLGAALVVPASSYLAAAAALALATLLETGLLGRAVLRGDERGHTLLAPATIGSNASR